jgi:uncharacterized membrane protein
MAIKIDTDLKIILGLTVVSMFFITVPPLDSSLLRIPLGIIMIIFIPGYSLLAAIFTKKGDFDGIERIALSVGLSVAVAPLIGLMLNYTPFGIRLVPIAAALTIFIFLASAVAVYRRGVLDESERFRFEIGRKGLKEEMGWKKGSNSDRMLMLVLVVAIVSSIGALVYVTSRSSQGERFTEFYILGEDMKAEGYPSVLGVGEKGQVNVGIKNNEYETVNYTVVLKTGDTVLDTRSVVLENGKNVTYLQTFSMPEKGENRKVEFLLYKNGQMGTPYRAVHLWITVR